jgi:hypothetical protein
MSNLNTKESLEHMRSIIMGNLQSLQGAPSVQFQEVPPDFGADARANTVSGSSNPDEDDSGKSGGGADYRARDVSATSRGGEGQRSAHPAEHYENDADNGSKGPTGQSGSAMDVSSVD